MKEVFEGSLWEAELIKGLLQSEHINCMLRDDTLSAITSPYFNAGGSAKILVNDEDFLRASQIANTH